MKKLLLLAFLFGCTDDIGTPDINGKPCDVLKGEYLSYTTREDFNRGKRKVLEDVAIGKAPGVKTKRGTTAKDSDGDGVPDSMDNCPYTANADQKDSNLNGIGDACETTVTPPPPSATNKLIYLDYDGYYLNSAYWNGGVPRQLAPSGLTLIEMQTVRDLVANYFAPYNINVTLDEATYLSAAGCNKIRMVITTDYQWFSQNAGGVAYYNSMFNCTEIPAFVFSSMLGFYPVTVAACSAHEAGHSVGLDHQALWDANCKLIDNYNPGTGNEGPIMGAGNMISKWWVGPTPKSCTSIQDDNAILSNKLGIR